MFIKFKLLGWLKFRLFLFIVWVILVIKNFWVEFFFCWILFFLLFYIFLVSIYCLVFLFDY